MVTGALLSVSYNRIAAFNKKNDFALATSLLHLASGKRVQQPSDSVTDFFVISKQKQNNSIHENIRTDLAATSSLTDVAELVGTYIFDDLSTLKSLVDDYYEEGISDEEKESIKTEFSTVIAQISSTIENSRWNGEQVVRDTGASWLVSVAIDSANPDEKLTLSFTSNQVADVSTLTLGTTDYATEGQAVQNELNKAASFLSEVSVFKRSVNAFYNINETKITATQNSISRMSDINTGEEMIRAMDKSIRQQSSLAMMAQANMVRGSILRLFE